MEIFPASRSTRICFSRSSVREFGVLPESFDAPNVYRGLDEPRRAGLTGRGGSPFPGRHARKDRRGTFSEIIAAKISEPARIGGDGEGTSREQGAESREQRAESREQRAGSREQA